MSDAKVLPMNLTSLSMEQLQKRLRELDQSRKPVQITLTIPPDVYEVIQGIAHHEGTSVTMVAANILTGWVARCVENSVNTSAGQPLET